MEDQAITERNLRFLTGSEFEAWRKTELDGRAEAHLVAAVNAASLMTPEGCFKAAHHLLLYASVNEMGKGATQRAEMNLYHMEQDRQNG